MSFRIINLHHKLLKPEKLFWPSSLSGAAQLDHCFQVKGLRKEVGEGYGLDSVAGSDERAQITSQRGGVAGDTNQRGRSDLGTTFMDVLYRYAQALAAVDSKLVIVSANERIVEQLGVTGITDVIGEANVYPGDERVGATVKRAYADAVAWVDANR